MMAMPVATRVPLDIGAIHFIGIGGIGMSGIAEIMHNLGYKVQGSDVAESANVKRLRAMGIPVAIGHAAENLKDAHAVVYSSAVKPGNVEFDAARGAGLPLVRRAEMLAEIMRLQLLRRHRRHQRQDHHHHHGGGAAGCGRHGSHRGQWRHHQRLWHQCAAGRGRMGGGGGRRKRRHLPAPARHRRGGHQRRSRSSGLSTAPSTRCATPSSASSRMCRSMASRCCASIIPKCRRWSAASPTAASSPMASVPQADARAVNVSLFRRRLAFRRGLHRPPQGHARRGSTVCACPCRASTMCRMPWPPSWWRASWASATT